MSRTLDAVVVGAGPNGLAAAIVLAEAGRSVAVVEARETIGGSCRTAELTLPGFRHDVCSAIHPMAVASPFFARIPLERHGLRWIHPKAPLAHPLDDGSAALLHRSVEATGATLGTDASAWAAFVDPFLDDADALFAGILRPMRVPRHPLALARFGVSALRSAAGVVNARFRGERARALFGGCAGHSILPLDKTASAAIGLVLAIAGHSHGWPCAAGGSQSIADALAARLRELGGTLETGREVRSLADLPGAHAVLFDVAPRALERIAGEALPVRYRAALRAFRHGPGVFKVDWALAGPIPWTARECERAGVVHVGGTMEEIADSERAAWSATPAERPFVLVAQPSLFDPTRAPAGRHVVWGYCHVPNGCTVDMTTRIEAQIERFAPGFRDRIRARVTTDPARFAAYDANYVGGDISGGANTLFRIFARPVARLVPCATPDPSLFLCSSSTPPGAGVHGICGWFAAKVALRRVFGRRIARLPTVEEA